MTGILRNYSYTNNSKNPSLWFWVQKCHTCTFYAWLKKQKHREWESPHRSPSFGWLILNVFKGNWKWAGFTDTNPSSSVTRSVCSMEWIYFVCSITQSFFCCYLHWDCFYSRALGKIRMCEHACRAILSGWDTQTCEHLYML